MFMKAYADCGTSIGPLIRFSRPLSGSNGHVYKTEFNALGEGRDLEIGLPRTMQL